MKRLLIRLVTWLLLLATGFGIGRSYEFGRSGRTFEVRDSKDYDSPMGPVHWSYVTDSPGMALLDPGTTIIEYDGRTIYKAKRIFQETSPFADNVKTADKTIDWDDGDYRFHLTIDPMERMTKEGQEAGASLPKTEAK